MPEYKSPLLKNKFQLLIFPRFLGDGLLAFTVIDRLLYDLATEKHLIVVLPESLHEWANKLFSNPRLHIWKSSDMKGKAWIELLKPIANKCEVAYIFRRSISEAFWLWKAGIQVRVGFACQRYPWGMMATRHFLTNAIPYNSHERNQHELIYWLKLLQSKMPHLQESLSFRGLSQRFRDILPKLSSQYFTKWGIESLMENNIDKKLLIVHWSSASTTKYRSATELYEPLLKRLQTGKYLILLSGTYADQANYEPLLKLLYQANYTQNTVSSCAGKTQWEDLPLLLSIADELWSLDSGTVHLAALLDKPPIVRVLYAGDLAGSYPERWGILASPNLYFRGSFTVGEMLMDS